MSIETLSEAILKIAERFGVPVVLLGIAIWLGREAAITIHATVVTPVVESHTAFIETICEQAKQQTKAMESQAGAFKELAEAHDEQITILRQAFPASVAEGRRTAPAAPQ